MIAIKKPSLAFPLACVLLAAGCGSSSPSTQTTTTTPAGANATGATGPSATSTTTTNGGSSAQGPGALTADARSAATGDIPDTQIFLVFTDTAAGYSMKYPEGWTQSGSGRDIRISDKNNLVHITIANGSAPTLASVGAQLNALRASQPTLSFSAPQTITIGSSPAVKTVYTTESAPNPVTGRRVKLIVDRYVLSHAGHVATVYLGTPVGVDNVDAYRMMIESFQWK